MHLDLSRPRRTVRVWYQNSMKPKEELTKLGILCVIISCLVRRLLVSTVDVIVHLHTIYRDEVGQADKAGTKDEREARGSCVGKCSVAHEASGINHGKLVDKLHGVYSEQVRK
jgi:hypothetical protein